MNPGTLIPNHLSIVSCTPDDCPIGHQWHQHWRKLTLDLVSQPEWRRRYDALDRRLAGTPAPDWSVGPGDASRFPGKKTPPLTKAAHRHLAFTVADHNVHIDLIEGTGSGPGFGIRALLIHVDGELRGSAFVYGCLGGNGNSFPAVARINHDLAVYGNYREGGYDGMPYILVQRAWPPTPAKDRETAETPRESVTVKMRTLSQAEFDSLRSKDQEFAEAATQALMDRYGEGFFQRNNDRLRKELQIVRQANLHQKTGLPWIHQWVDRCQHCGAGLMAIQRRMRRAESEGPYVASGD